MPGVVLSFTCFYLTLKAALLGRDTVIIYILCIKKLMQGDKAQFILIIYRSHTCHLAYLLKSVTCVFVVIQTCVYAEWQKIKSPNMHIPS